MKTTNKFLSYLLILALTFAFIPIPLAQANPLTALSDTMSRMKDSEPSDHTIKFTTPTGAGDVTDTITIAFPTGFTIGSVDYTDIDLSHGVTTGYETEETLANPADATSWGAAFSGQTLTLTHPTNAANGDIALADKVVVEIGQNATGGGSNAQIANQTVAQNNSDQKIVIDGAFGDDGTIAVEIVTNDQVTLSATVDPSISFGLSANSSDFSTLSTSAPSASSPDITLTITTNAGSGCTITVRDEGNGASDGLYNSIAAYLIDSATALLQNNTEGYGIQGATTGSGSGGTLTIDGVYDKSGNNVGGLQRTAQTLATAGSSVSGREVVVTHKASISGLTKAGTYNDTLTYIATGNF